MAVIGANHEGKQRGNSVVNTTINATINTDIPILSGENDYVHWMDQIIQYVAKGHSIDDKNITTNHVSTLHGSQNRIDI